MDFIADGKPQGNRIRLRVREERRWRMKQKLVLVMCLGKGCLASDGERGGGGRKSSE